MASNGKIVLITGASRGVGLGLVKEYSKRGFKVVATCRDPSKAKDLSNFLKDHGHPGAFSCDVAMDLSISNCFKAIKDSGIDKIDILVNNAGISNKNHPDDLASDVDRKEFVEIINVNTAGPLSVTNSFKELLEKANKPMVINISSSLGSLQDSPRFSTTSYQCSKAAVNMLNKCQAFAMPNIKFVAIHPGWVQTDMGSSKNRSPPVTVEQSAQGIADVAERADESGSFWSFEGHQMPY